MLHTELPIYKKGVELVSLAFHVQTQMRGFSTGATMAGVQVVWAANHWPAAVQVHANNHPATQHACQDLQQASQAA